MGIVEEIVKVENIIPSWEVQHFLREIRKADRRRMGTVVDIFYFTSWGTVSNFVVDAGGCCGASAREVV